MINIPTIYLKLNHPQQTDSHNRYIEYITLNITEEYVSNLH